MTAAGGPDGAPPWAEAPAAELAAALAAYVLTAPDAGLPLPDVEARVFFARHFAPRPVPVEAFYTAYYEPELEGRAVPDARFRFPLYGPPAGLPPLPDVPWFTRLEIEDGDLLAGLELVWLDDPLDAFLAQVQGSVRVRLPGGESLRLGFAGKNGHPYCSIGRELVARGMGADGAITIDGIRDWAARHPQDLPALLRTNPSFVFFRRLDIPSDLGPVTTSGVPATPWATLAVDPDHVPLGLPVWVETPDFARLMIAQDTGSAIRGAGRGDIFLGTGNAAGLMAGAMQVRGRMTVLVPRAAGSEEARG